jgi:hypothetical protein
MVDVSPKRSGFQIYSPPRTGEGEGGVIPQGPHLLETSKTSVYNEPKA